ncbi:MarR family transcriptional regulator [Streptomyces diastaticus]|uniref:MarR family transcriptional regulator n=1 Tax=Streptomyces diastaticus TaxID=1956 RepID=UPI003659B2C4
MALGAMNAWAAQMDADYAALSTALCLCICAAGLFGETLVQREHRQDLVVLAHVEAHPGAEPRGIARSVGAPEHMVARNLSRLTESGFVVLVDDEPALSCGEQYRQRSPVTETGDRAQD